MPTEQELSFYGSGISKTHIHLTKFVNKLHDMTDESVNKTRLAESEEKQFIRKSIIYDINRIIQSESMSLADLQTLSTEVQELVIKKLCNTVGRTTECATHQESYGSSDQKTNGSKHMVCETLEVGGRKYKFAAKKGNSIDVESRMKSRGTL